MRIWTRIHWKHKTACAMLVLLALVATLLWVTHFNPTTIISLSLVFSSVSLALVYGMQSVLQNCIAGLSLRAERKLRVGMVIAVGGPLGQEGTVSDIRLRTTVLTTKTGEWPVPNSTLYNPPGYEIRTKEDPCLPKS